MSEQQPEKQIETARLVYLGRRFNQEGKVSFVWREIDNTSWNFIDRERWYKKQHVACSPGSVFDFKVERGENTLTVYSAKVGVNKPFRVQLWPIQPDREAWQVEDETVAAQLRRDKKAKAEQKAADVQTGLEPYRLAYAKSMSAAQRADILASVIEYITRYRPGVKP